MMTIDNLSTRRPTRIEIVDMMMDRAMVLYQALVLEKFEHRDGDGTWHGSDPIFGCIDDLARLDRKLHLWTCGTCALCVKELAAERELEAALAQDPSPDLPW